MRNGLIAVAVVLLATSPASAHHRHAKRAPAAEPHQASTRGIVPDEIPPSADAVELAGIAPPTRPGTAVQTYGDAAYARARAQSRYEREEEADAVEAATVGVPNPCDPRVATADSYACRNPARLTDYRAWYAFTPSRVSAPTVVDQDPSVQEPVMPAVTRFFWSVNSSRIDPNADRGAAGAARP